MTETMLPDDLRPIVEQVARRDRRRIRLLASATIALWVLAILFVPAVFLPLAAKIKYHLIVLGELASTTHPALADVRRDSIPRLVEMILVVTAIMIGAMLLTSLLASICTVALALTIRRVTLRQVTASLAQISEQLRQLRRASD
jgi:hypothetical protein